MTAQIEYTERYGGHPPSWLRGCFACEARGVSPRWYGEVAPGGTMLIDADDDRDLWEVVRCADCGGSGRVSWWRTVLRVPRWLWLGVGFVWDMGVRRNKRCRPEHWTWRRQLATVLCCAFLVDVGLWQPVASCERWPDEDA